MNRFWSILVVALMCLPTASAKDGANLLSNGAFDVGVYVAEWLPLGTSTIEWHSADSEGEPGSGSAIASNNSAFPSSWGARQCIEVIEGDPEYFLSAMIFVPSGQPTTGWGALFIEFMDSPNCQGRYVDFHYSPKVRTTTPDQWLESAIAVAAPPTAQSAWVLLAVAKDQATGSLTAAFDNVRVLSGAEVFTDGFESGDPSRWSAIVP